MAALHDTEQGLEVELVISHGQHLLRRDSPDFERLHEILAVAHERRVEVLVTENDAHEIVDVRLLDDDTTG